MSQFQNNYGFNPDQVNQILGSFAGTGYENPFMRSNPRQSRRAQVDMQTPTGSFVRDRFQPYVGGGPSGYMQNSRGLSRNPGGFFRSSVPNQYFAWDQALAGAMGQDMRQQQSAMNEMFSQLNRQTGTAESELTGGIDAFLRQSQQQYQNLQGVAGNVEQAGQSALGRVRTSLGDVDRANQFGQGVYRDVTERVNRSDEQANLAVQDAEKMVKDFRDTSAQDAANAAFGMRRNVESTLRQIEANPDLSPAERQAMRMELTQQTESQVTQAVTGIFSNMNTQMANLQGQLSQVRMAQAGITQQGAGLIGQVGTTVSEQMLRGAQFTSQMTLEAENMNLRMQELGAGIRVNAENAAAAAQMQATMALLQGRESLYQMIQGNPMQFVSQFAGLTGYLAAASTPGLARISIPNF